MYHVVFTYIDLTYARGRNRLGISLPRVVARGIPGHGRHNGTRARASWRVAVRARARCAARVYPDESPRDDVRSAACRRAQGAVGWVSGG